MFQVREQLADEGKDHAELILVEVPCQSCGVRSSILPPQGKITCVAADLGNVRGFKGGQR